MAGYSEDDIRRAADIREWLVKHIADKQEEVDKLRTALSLIDSLLKQGSFRAAANLGAFAGAASTAATAQVQETRAAPQVPARQSSLKSADDRDIRPLKRAKDDFMLANAEVSPTSVIIVPVPGVALNINTPPFRSFFLNRILDGMRNKDVEKVCQGAIKEPDVLGYKVEDEGGNIRRIVIDNYRDKERLQEIFNTSAWVFTRMLEKSGS